jgi:hypothetical protein
MDLEETSTSQGNTVPPSGEMTRMDLEGTSTSQPATRTGRIDKRERLHAQQKQVVVDIVRPDTEKLIASSVSIQATDKHRIKEVDYSEKLRETVYNQEEQINTMRREMQKVRSISLPITNI